jgi:hypothetical protein
LTWKAGLGDALSDIESLIFFLQVKNDTTTLHAVRFPHVSNQEEDMEHLTSACEEATFGKAGKEDPVLDPNYRYVVSISATQESEAGCKIRKILASASKETECALSGK